MSGSATTRERMTHLVIAVGAVISAHTFLIEPQQKRFQALDVRIEQLEEASQSVSTPVTPTDDVSKRLAQLRNLAREIGRGNEPFDDATALYEHITALADRRQIELGPFSPKQREASKDRPAALSLRIVATGTYEGLAEFADAIQHEAGFSRIAEFSLRPIGELENPLVRATMQIEFLHFDLPDALATLVEASHAGN